MGYFCYSMKTLNIKIIYPEKKCKSLSGLNLLNLLLLLFSFTRIQRAETSTDSPARLSHPHLHKLMAIFNNTFEGLEPVFLCLFITEQVYFSILQSRSVYTVQRWERDSATFQTCKSQTDCHLWALVGWDSTQTCGLSFIVVVIKLPTKTTVFSSQMLRSSNITFVSAASSDFGCHCELIDPNPLILGMRNKLTSHAAVKQAEQEHFEVNWSEGWMAFTQKLGSKVLTTNLVRPVPPAFPTKIPELASNVRGWALLLKATLWYSSQSM